MSERELPSPIEPDFEDSPPPGFFSTGSTVLDCALGGGWAVARVANIIGEPATGKSLLGIEGAANFQRKYGNARIIHVDTEAAFDPDYAKSLGLKLDDIELHEGIETVEQLGTLCETVLKDQMSLGEDAPPVLLIIDSLDALTTAAEQSRSMEDGTFGLEKPKLLSQLFRRYIRQLSRRNVTVMFMSQVRANVTAGPFQKQTTTTGGKAVRFYCSQIIELTKLKQIKRTAKKVERVIGVHTKAKVDKNRCGPSHRSVDFPIHFGYGVHDEESMVSFLAATGRGDLIGLTNSTQVGVNAFLRDLQKLDLQDFWEHRKNLRKAVREAWQSIEDDFAPVRAKYG